MNELNGKFVEDRKTGKTFTGSKQIQSQSSTNRTMQYMRKHKKKEERGRSTMLVTKNSTKGQRKQQYIDYSDNEDEEDFVMSSGGKTKFIH